MRLQRPSSPMPKASPSMSQGGGMAKPVSTGFGLKHKLRKGTEFQGMSPADSGMGDAMSDYARALAAKGGL